MSLSPCKMGTMALTSRKQGDNPLRPHVSYPLQDCCQQCVAQLYFHDGRGKISCLWRDGNCGGAVHGDFLCQWRPSWVVGPGVAPRRPQRTRWPIPKLRTGGYCRQIQIHDLSSRSDPVWDIRRGIGPADHGEGGEVQVEANMVDTISIA